MEQFRANGASYIEQLEVYPFLLLSYISLSLSHVRYGTTLNLFACSYERESFENMVITWSYPSHALFVLPLSRFSFIMLCVYVCCGVCICVLWCVCIYVCVRVCVFCPFQATHASQLNDAKMYSDYLRRDFEQKQAR